MNINNIHKKGIDYLLFGLLDAVIDNYFVILDKIGIKIEDIEDEIINNPDEEMIMEIQNLKKSAIFLQKSIVPVREITSKLEKVNHFLITNDTKHYFRDLHDHIIQIVETLGTYGDILWGLTDNLYGSYEQQNE